MKRIQMLGFAASILLLLSCHQKSMSGDTTTANAETSTNKTVKNVTIDAKADMTNVGASYTIDSIGMNGDVLSVFVNYSGGCKDHSFELISNEMYAKSLPPQITLCLKHTNNDDACRKLIMQELKFNVAAVKYKGTNTTIIKIADKQTTYKGN